MISFSKLGLGNNCVPKCNLGTRKENEIDNDPRRRLPMADGAQPGDRLLEIHGPLLGWDQRTHIPAKGHAAPSQPVRHAGQVDSRPGHRSPGGGGPGPGGGLGPGGGPDGGGRGERPGVAAGLRPGRQDSPGPGRGPGQGHRRRRNRLGAHPACERLGDF